MKGLLFASLGLSENVLFTELLERDERKNEKLLTELLDGPTKDINLYSSALIFYAVVSEVTREVEVEEGS